MKAEHLLPKQCALLVVDIQERLMNVIHQRERVTRNSVLLLKTANVLGIPVISSTQYAARIGPLLSEVTEEMSDILPYDKMEFDCFKNDPIRQAIKKMDPSINTLIVCGVECHICIYQTVIGALQSGFHVWVAADAVSSRTPENYCIGLERLVAVGAVKASTEMIIYDLLGKAGTESFKSLLPFLK